MFCLPKCLLVAIHQSFVPYGHKMLCRYISNCVYFRICETVLEYYSGQFVDRWKFRTDSSTINNLAALLFEKDGAMKVVVFTAGAPKKGECSYSLNNGSADECMWGHCDGHVVSVCYSFANFFLITEMQRHKKDPQASILETKPDGYEFKKSHKVTLLYHKYSIWLHGQ